MPNSFVLSSKKGCAAEALSIWEQRGLGAATTIRRPLPFVILHPLLYL